MKLEEMLRQKATHSRFWAKVNKDGPNGCWEWTAGIGSHGYGAFYPSGRRSQVLAHRWSIGANQGEEVLHLCDNKVCVNPAHLRIGTHRENMEDAANKAMMFAPRAHQSVCPHGHEMSDSNTIFKYKQNAVTGKRYLCRSCRECNRLYLANRRAKRRASK